MISIAWGIAIIANPVLHAAQGAELKPEKNKLEVAIAASGPLYLTIILANEAGYFSKRGVTVNLSTLSATASAQALLSGQVDIYQGGTATSHANVAGSDLIYIAASVDRSTLILFGQKGLTTFDNLRGKSVATTSVGAFGEIAMRKTAKERGMEIGKDIKLLYHKGPPDALSTFLVGNADGLIVISDLATGFWAFKMDGFDGWYGHQWGMPNISSAQDWDNGPEGAPKPAKIS